MFRVIALIVAATLSVACTTSPSRTIDVSAGEEEMTHDGLYPVTGTLVKMAWARKDIDLTGYNKILIQRAGIQYRPVKATTAQRMGVSSSSEFPLDEKQKARLRKEVERAFQEEIQKGENYAIVTAPGPDVLIVRGALLDVVSFVPPERPGRNDVYLDRVGAATLVIELVDSESEAVLARIVDRRAAEQRGVTFKSTSVTNATEVRRLARFWAKLLRESLDNLSSNLDIAIAQ